MWQNNINYSIILSLLVGLSMVSCKVGNVKIPEAPPLSTSYRFQHDSTEGTELPGYRSFYLNPSLLLLLDSAWNANFDVQLAVQQVELAKLTRNQTKKNLFPSVTANLQGVTTRPADNSLNGISVKSFLGTTHVEDFSIGAQLTWEADLWGKLYYQRKQAGFRYMQSEEGLRSVRSKFINLLAQEYYKLIWLKEQQKLLNQNVRLSDSIHQAVSGLQEMGSAGIIDLQLALANKRNADLLLPDIEEQIGQTEHVISILSGRIPGEIQTDGTLIPNEFIQLTAIGKPIDLLRNRPSVRYAEIGLHVQANQIGIATASLYPTLQLSLSSGLNSYLFSNWINWPASLFGIAGGGLLQPVFQQKKLKLNQQQAKIQLQTAFTTFNQELFSGMKEVSDALLKEKINGTRLEIASALVADLEIAIQQARESFHLGEITYLEVLTVQERWIRASMDLLNVKYQLAISRIHVYQALGGGQIQ